MSAHAVTSIGIAGWGDPATGLPYRMRIAHAGTASGTVSPAPILAGHPSELSTRIDLADSWVESGSLTAKVGRIDEHAVAIALRRFLFASRPVPLGYIAADVNRTQTSIFFIGSPEGSEPATDTVLFIGREAVKVTNVTGGGTTKTLTVTRGMFGTVAQTHSAHPLLGDRWVYDVNPIVETREVIRYDYDPATDTETARWRGILEPPALDNNLTTITIKARDSWGGIRGRRLGEGRVILSGRMGVVPNTQNSLTGEPLRGLTIDHPPGDLDTPTAPLFPGGNSLVLASDEAIASATFDVLSSSFAGTTIQLSDQEVVPLFKRPGSAWVEMPDEPDMIREVLIADAESEYPMFRDENEAPSDHPLDVLLNIWTSTGEATWPVGGSHLVGSNGDYDWLPGHWGLGIPVAEIDTAGINTLRDGLLLGARVQNFVLGADSDPVDAVEVVKRLLQPLFLFPTYTTDGKLTVAAVDDPGPGNAVASITQGDIVGPVRAQPWSTQRRYRGSETNVGRLWPAAEYGEKWVGSGGSAGRRNREPFGKSVIEIDAGDYGAPGTGLVDSAQRRLLERFDTRRLIVLRDRLPEYSLEFRAGVAELAAGQWIELTLGVVVGEDGDRNQVEEHRCMVLEAKRRPDDRVQEVRVLDFYAIARATKKVLPCWRIASVAADDEFTIVSNEFTTNDTATWIDGAPVNLYSKRGKKRSTDGTTFGTITGTTVVLDQQWEAGAVSVTPSVGDVIMPGPYDEAVAYWPDGAWFADSDGTLGSLANIADLARWGL